MAYLSGKCQAAFFSECDQDDWTLPGIVSGGSWAISNNVYSVNGIGGYSVDLPGMKEFSFSLDFAVMNADIFGYMLRSETYFPCSAVPCIDVKIYDGITAPNTTMLLTDSKIDTVSIKAETGGALTASVSGKGMGFTETANVALPTVDAPTDPFSWHEAVVTFETNNYKVNSFSIDIGNGVEGLTDMGAKATGTLTFPQYLMEGNQTLTMSLETNEYIPLSVLGIAGDTYDNTLAFKAIFTKGAASITIEVTNLICTNMSEPLQGDGSIVRRSYDFKQADNVTGGLTIT
jgi:hypothetical protein